MKKATRPGDLQVAADGTRADCLRRAQVSSVLLSIRDVEELFAERGLEADHTTIWRWVQRYGPELDQRLLSALRDANAAKRLFRKALNNPSHPQPRVINTDLAPIYGSAIPDIKKEGTLRSRSRHRLVQYLNNILEQDHRAIQRRVRAKQGFREFHAAQRTLQGYEAIHMMRKGRVRWVSGTDVVLQIRFIKKLFDLPF